MTGWVIVPKGEGDLVARLKLTPSAKAAIEVTLFLHPGQAEAALQKLPKGQRDLAEVKQVEVTLR